MSDLHFDDDDDDEEEEEEELWTRLKRLVALYGARLHIAVLEILWSHVRIAQLHASIP